MTDEPDYQGAHARGESHGDVGERCPAGIVEVEGLMVDRQPSRLGQADELRHLVGDADAASSESAEASARLGRIGSLRG